ncbi:MAG: hypothetical protein EAZ95_15230 [Bacteroidetes bacterium]|nr:MAG: hypothetical protein EAZ95_15230 [Bacteroidota bacterium]
MENSFHDLLAQITPRSLFQILETYTLVGEAESLHTTFLDFRHIQHFTLFGLEQHREFLSI